MPALPPRLSLEQVRRLAKDLLRDLKDGDRAAIRRLAVVSAPSTLAGAQLAIAREYGFPSWARLKRDVELREILDSLDVGRLRALVAEEPDLASTTMEHWGLAEHEGVDGYREVEAILVPITDPIFGGWPPRRSTRGE